MDSDLTWRGGLRASDALRPDQRVHNLPLNILTYLLCVNTNQTVHDLPSKYLPTSYTLTPTSSLMGVKIFRKSHSMSGTNRLQMT